MSAGSNSCEASETSGRRGTRPPNSSAMGHQVLSPGPGRVSGQHGDVPLLLQSPPNASWYLSGMGKAAQLKNFI